jgi:DNA replication protein DnaC
MHEEFLKRFLAMEVRTREINRKTRYIKAAGFDVIKTFEDYVFDDVQVPASIGVDDIRQAEFVERKENLILYVAVGIGKTHLTTAVGVEACNRDMPVKYMEIGVLEKLSSKARILDCQKHSIRHLKASGKCNPIFA